VRYRRRWQLDPQCAMMSLLDEMGLLQRWRPDSGASNAHAVL
jgi:hypothetical protein